MVVDRRHDHSFRVPRPDLSPALGTTNACTDCHTDKSPDWAAAAIEGWFGPDAKGIADLWPGLPCRHGSDAPDAERAARRGRRGRAMLRPSPAPALCTALAAYVSPANARACAERSRRSRPDGAARRARHARKRCRRISSGRWSRRSSPIRCAACAFAPPALLAGAAGGRASLRGAPELRATRRKEFIAAQELNADRPESRAMLGGFHARRGEMEEGGS